MHPARVKKQFTGVFSLELQRLYDAVMKETHENYCVVFSLDGYDEISLTSSVKITTPHGEKILEPEEFGFSTISPHAIYGGSSAEEATRIMLSVLKNEASAEQKSVALANAAMAIQTADPTIDIATALDKAKESLESGKALQVLNQFRNIMK